MKVYVFMLKKFFIKNGVDYAMPIGNDDLKVFSSLEDAEIFRSEIFENDKGLAGDKFLKEEIHTKSDWNFLALHFRNGSRFIYEIFSCDLISSLVR